MYAICGLLAFSLGIMLSIQSGINAFLREMTSNPIFAVTINFSVGMLMILLATMIRYRRHTCKLPGFLELRKTKWWMYVGGILGVILVLGSVLITKKIGFTPYFSLLIAGQLVGSVLADSVGFLGGEVIVPDLRRISGIIILVMGAILAQK